MGVLCLGGDVGAVDVGFGCLAGMGNFEIGEGWSLARDLDHHCDSSGEEYLHTRTWLHISDMAES